MIIISFFKQLSCENKIFRCYYKKFIHIFKSNIIFIIINLCLNIRLRRIFSRVFNSF